MVATEKLIQELKGAREGAALYDASAWGQFLAKGPDAANFLHRMLSNEVQKLPIGEGRYQGLLDRKGLTLSLFYLKRLGDQEFLGVTPPQLTEKTISYLSKMKFIEKLTITNISGEHGLLFVIGPKAPALKETLGARPSLLIWDEETFGIPWITVGGPKAEVEVAVDALTPKTVRIGDEALRLLQMAAGFPEYGTDLTEASILLETAIPPAHQRSKGCYPGQEVIERISTYGKGRAPRRLVHFAIPGEKELAKGTVVTLKDGAAAGKVTSALFDPLENVTRVMASLEAKYLDQFSADVGQCQFLPPTSA
jgi:folate-binding protein YgfZ